jgi:hypothetical protein
MSDTPSKRVQAGVALVCQLEQELLKLKPLMRLLEAIGVDPTGPEAEQTVSSMMAGLFRSVEKIRQPRQAADLKAKWTPADDMTLRYDIERFRREVLSEREAVRRVAAEYPPETHRFPYKAHRGKSFNSDPQKLYEGALWRRWMSIKEIDKDKYDWGERSDNRICWAAISLPPREKETDKYK